MNIYLFNVGAGDNILIQFPNGEFGLIDFFFRSKLNENMPPSIAFLKNLSKTQKIIIAFCCVSHYDYDHLYGSEFFWKWYRKDNFLVRNVWLGGADTKNRIPKIVDKIKQSGKIVLDESESSQFNFISSKIKGFLEEFSKFVSHWETSTKKTAKYLRNIAPINNALCEGIKSFSVGPLDKHIIKYEDLNFIEFLMQLYPSESKPLTADNNLISSIIFLQSNSFSWVFGGDAPKQVWHDGIDENKSSSLGFNLSSDFIKVSHHGSSTSSSDKIWKELTSGRKKVIFGISAGNKYRHPDIKTLKEIKANCNEIECSICSTNVCGNCIDAPAEEYDLFRKEVSPETKLFSDDRSPFYQEKSTDNSQKGLLGFRFEFGLDDNTVKTFKLLDKGIPFNPACNSSCKIKFE